MLQDIIGSAVKELNAKKLSLIAAIASRSADAATTLLGVYGYGSVEVEQNAFVRGFMESYGPLKGLLLSEAILGLPSIVVMYGIGKLIGLGLENQRDRNIFENVPLILLAVGGVPAVINNTYRLLT